MAHSDELREMMVRHFKRLGIKQPTCPLCQNTEWAIEALTVQGLYDHTPHGPGFRGQSIMVVPMICTRCSYIHYLSYGTIQQGDADG